MGKLSREDFDRGRSFVVLREFTFAGEHYVPNQVPDTSSKGPFTTRRLRQLYDMRQIGYPPKAPAAEAPKLPEPVAEAVSPVEVDPPTPVVRRRAVTPPKNPSIERRRAR